ncbi:GNAT family N-acetyltransferase [Pseudalkalibacillus salsuginis]|uniref:GNAT family N-acetyltransferase n=1 Tax=Pseudalkalibacillus salsuginis TaxID=2910972 RepID=UPI001F2E26D0|nr:GNAT family N-acetyltransferase [Pseudalkalibacillus salsuginis]MCF6409821.1 GNAT family N-acetyltransferase [Pseudalkalibacillus salsuginis]
MEIRQMKKTDYEIVSPLLDEWWGGRQMSGMVPKLFFNHFNNTSFIAEQDGKIVGFLIGFLSQSSPEEAYIHFVGVDPDYRKYAIGRTLYHRFFEVVKEHGRNTIRAITSPVNKGSIAYHTKMGFEIEKGDTEVDGVSVFADYDGAGNDRVLFVKRLF